MKIKQEDRTIRRSGKMPEKAFGIAATAKAFDILSSKLYTDARLAIVRELSTNAYDSQVEAGTADRPFDVHLPNSMEPYLSIRDYGTGLSPEQVEHIYTTYFASTRNDSDDYVGALGLGSKSPFAYTDQFTVTSYQDGRAYAYSAYKNEQGEPTIALLSDDPTDEANGVEIRLNTQDNDGYDFLIAARKVYRFFPVCPNVTGQRLDMEEHEPIFEGDGYKLYRGSSGLPAKVNVVMGNICYAVKQSTVSGKLGYEGYLLLEAEIGECEIAASREELHMSEATIAAIQDRFDNAFADIHKQIEAELGDDLCRLQRVIQMQRFRQVMDFSSQPAARVPTKVYKGYQLKRAEVRSGKLRLGYDSWESELNPRAETTYVFVQNDLDRDLKQSDKNKLRYYLSGKKGVFYLVAIEDEKIATEYLGEISAKLSELPDPPKAQRTGRSGVSHTYVKSLQMMNYRVSRMQDNWKSIDDLSNVDTTDAICVPRDGYDVVINGKRCSAGLAREFAEAMGYDRVYGIATRYYDRIREELGMPDLTEESKKYAESRAKKLSVFQLSRWQHNIGTFYGLDHKLLKWVDGLSDVCNNYVKLAKATPVDDSVQNMISMFGIVVPKAVDYRDIFYKQYPLLSEVSSYVQEADVIEYIKLKESN